MGVLAPDLSLVSLTRESMALMCRGTLENCGLCQGGQHGVTVAASFRNHRMGEELEYEC